MMPLRISKIPPVRTCRGPRICTSSSVPARTVYMELPMTSSTLARCSNRHGFTLTEMLVVIGVLVLVAGLLLPMLTRAYRQSSRARTAADLQAIAAGLEAYKQDFGDYPDIPMPP